MEERFWDKVNKIVQSDCWEWTAYRNRDGYGQFKMDNRMKKSHRVAWELVNGPIPDGICVLHHCDNPGCVNPSHLFLGTHADNAQDRNSKGRQASHKGEKNGRSKLEEMDVLFIRYWLKEGYTYSDIATVYGVHNDTIRDIKTGKNWGWLDVNVTEE